MKREPITLRPHGTPTAWRSRIRERIKDEEAMDTYRATPPVVRDHARARALASALVGWDSGAAREHPQDHAVHLTSWRDGVAPKGKVRLSCWTMATSSTAVLSANHRLKSPGMSQATLGRHARLRCAIEQPPR